MIKIRLQGTEKELNQAMDRIHHVFNVLEASKPYKNRGESQYCRIYVDCEMVDNNKKGNQ